MAGEVTSIRNAPATIILLMNIVPNYLLNMYLYKDRVVELSVPIRQSSSLCGESKFRGEISTVCLTVYGASCHICSSYSSGNIETKQIDGKSKKQGRTRAKLGQGRSFAFINSKHLWQPVIRPEKHQINHKFRMDGEVAHESLILDEKLVKVGRCYERDCSFQGVVSGRLKMNQ